MAQDEHTQGIPTDRTTAVPVPPAAPAGEPPPRVGAAGSGSGWVLGAPRPSPTPWAPPPAAQGAWAPPPWSPSTTGRRAGIGLGTVLAAAVLAGVLGGLAGGYAVGARAPDDSGPTVVEALPVAADGSGASVAQIARIALPSVVFISVEAEEGQGVGSGFVIREDGYIVTNSHVIEGADEGQGIMVDFTDGETLEAEVIGEDSSYDIAVLKVERAGLPALAFGDSETLQVGSPVVAVGAPLGLDNTVTSGIVSALDRPVVAGDVQSTSYINAIQTDAAINPGNSGGPLIDLSGRVVGVNSAIAQIPGSAMMAPGGSIGLGFAIPAAQAERTATQLIETGTSDYPVIGVQVDLQYTGEGARVLPEATGDLEPVIPGGPAEEAGLQAGEVILAIDDTRIDDGSQLIVTLRSYAVGDTVEVLVRGTDGAERTVSITLQGSTE